MKVHYSEYQFYKEKVLHWASENRGRQLYQDVHYFSVRASWRFNGHRHPNMAFRTNGQPLAIMEKIERGIIGQHMHDCALAASKETRATQNLTEQ
jgi:hypothetical protein